MDFLADSNVNSSSQIVTSTIEPPKSLVQDALEANKTLQDSLAQRAGKLEAELQDLDQLLIAATVDESQDEPESEVSIPGAKKASGLLPSSEFLDPASPFYEEAAKRSKYMTSINPHPLKTKDLEILAEAVKQENQRLQAHNRSNPEPSILGQNRPVDPSDNVDGLDWERIAEKVSDASSVKRTATECRISWIADKQPNVNHADWSADELEKLISLVSEYTREKKTINWVKIAEKLGTHRIPIDCMRHGIPRHRHTWSPESDQKLVQAVESCGIDNWQLVARTVTEHVSAGQCQNRWQKTLSPALRKGAWTEDEDDRLRKAVVGYGLSWIQVATAIPGRTNDQCRERWTEHVKLSSQKVVWTDAEDQILLESVKELGNHWKAISLKIGNNKTGQNCRMRYDKLKRTEKNATKNASLASFSNAGLSSLPAPSMHEFSVHDSDASVSISTLPSQSKIKGKGKAKEKSQPSISNIGTVDGAPVPDAISTSATKKSRKAPAKAANTPEQTSTMTETSNVSPPKPRPRPRPKGKANITQAPTAIVVQSAVEPTVIPNPQSSDIGAIPDAAIEQPSSSLRGRKRKKPTSEAESDTNNLGSKRIKASKATTTRKARNPTEVEQSTELASSGISPDASQSSTLATHDSIQPNSIEAAPDSNRAPQRGKKSSRKNTGPPLDQEKINTLPQSVAPTRRSARQLQRK